MKKVVVLAVIVVIAFVGFAVLHNKAVSQSSAMASKSAAEQSANNPTKAKAQPKSPADDSPYVNGKANFIKSKFDFGYAPVNSTVFHPFYVSNVGSDTLDIVKIVPG